MRLISALVLSFLGFAGLLAVPQAWKSASPLEIPFTQNFLYSLETLNAVFVDFLLPPYSVKTSVKISDQISVIPKLHKREINEPQIKDSSPQFTVIEDFSILTESIPPGTTKYYRFDLDTSLQESMLYLAAYVSANLCNLISNDSSDTPVFAYYFSRDPQLSTTTITELNSGSGSSSARPQSAFTDGYYQDLVYLTKDVNQTTLYLFISVSASDIPKSRLLSANSDHWLLEIGISQYDLPLQWDAKTWVTLRDADDRSALFESGNITFGDLPSLGNLSRPTSSAPARFDVYIFTSEEFQQLQGLEKSVCAVRSAPSRFNTSDSTVRYIRRDARAAEQVYVTGLSAGTRYHAVAVSNGHNGTANPQTATGQVVFDAVEFSTMTSSTCQLIFDLPFCSEVAYSVPRGRFTDQFAENHPEFSDFRYSRGNFSGYSSLGHWEESLNIRGSNAVPLAFRALAAVYDSAAYDLYRNFSIALQNMPCNVTDSQRYTLLRDCDDCAIAYQQWLCATTIPRCSENSVPGYSFREPGESRSEVVNSVVQPDEGYYEVLPCIDLCYNLLTDCPFQFEFDCPVVPSMVATSYYWANKSMEDDGVADGNLMAGHVSCNAVGIDYGEVRYIPDEWEEESS